jgi:acyl-CoA dehydrogenase
MRFVIHELAGLNEVLALPCYADFDGDVIDQVVEEAGKFAADILSPINIPGDQSGARVEDNAVIAAAGFAAAYAQFVDNGWQGLVVAPEFGGMGLPNIVGAVAFESWQSACLSFSLQPMLTSGAIIALEAHGSDALQTKYLPNMVSGAWTGTMNLTESQAGSDLASISAKAVRDGDQYRISGAKIFITWGDQEYTENIIHLVLARLDDAPAGVRGVSLFLVPKYTVDDDGNIGAQNDVHVASIEHKLGIHASPTCVMNFGENDGAIGYLVGEENRGLVGMFTMMNHARVEVGVQGLAISERAYQQARSYAMERVQGRAPGIEGNVTIIHHPDVRRMLMIMKSQIEAMRVLAYVTGGMDDLARNAVDAESRANASAKLAFLTPIVKAWLTETAQEITSLGVQIHGGMGFIEETGAAQHMRDARILTIYEGTTGIQGSDFVDRKILADDGKIISEFIAEIRMLDSDLANDDRLGEIRAALTEGTDRLEKAVTWLLESAPADRNAGGASAVNMLMLAGVVIGGWQSARAALAIVRGAVADDAAFATSKLQTVEFYASHIMPRSAGYYRAATAGSDVVMSMPQESF